MRGTREHTYIRAGALSATIDDVTGGSRRALWLYWPTQHLGSASCPVTGAAEAPGGPVPLQGTARGWMGDRLQRPVEWWCVVLVLGNLWLSRNAKYVIVTLMLRLHCGRLKAGGMKTCDNGKDRAAGS